jgi:hypothetical protein
MAQYNFNGKFNVITSTPISGTTHNIQGLFIDDTGNFTASGILVGDRLMDSGGRRYEVSATNSLSGAIDLDVTEIDAIGAQPVTGNGAIFRIDGCNDTKPTLPVANVTASLQNYILHDAILIINDNLCSALSGGTGSGGTSVTGLTISGNTLILSQSDNTDVSIDLIAGLVKGEYDNDSDASSNSVLVGEVYEMSATNTLGLPRGTLKRRKT